MGASNYFLSIFNDYVNMTSLKLRNLRTLNIQEVDPPDDFHRIAH